MIKAIIFDFADTVIMNGVWQKVAIDFDRDKIWIKRSVKAFYAGTIPVKGVLPLIPKLKKKYKIGLLANSPKPWFDFPVSKFKLDKIFDALVSSGDTGLLKPEKEIYLLVCQKLGVLSKECVYIDDETDKIKLRAAQNLGMETILFKNSKQLILELKKRELL